MLMVEGCDVTRRTGWTAFQVGCTYIGTVVGAGFASGQEVYQFFGRFGDWGYVGIPIAILLFSWIGYRIMRLGRSLKARSYHEVNSYLFGQSVGRVMDVILMFMLLGVTVAMVAGAGELFRERIGVSFWIGAGFTLIVTYGTLFRGMNGVLRANSVIVPVMVSFVMFAFVSSLMLQGIKAPVAASHFLNHGHPVLAGISALIYSALNVSLAAGVLIPLGADIEDLEALRMGALGGAIGLGAMLCAVTITLFAHYPQALAYQVPMGYIASRFGYAWQWMFVFVLWGEIFSTLVGNVYAVGAQFAGSTPHRMPIATAVILLLALAMSQIGFSNIVHYGYTLFGWASLTMLAALLWPREAIPES